MGVTVLGVQHRVALRKESVDRNKRDQLQSDRNGQSLSARRAWIEIVNTADQEARKRLSLSARRAWIEIIDDFEPSSTRKCRSPQGERG